MFPRYLALAIAVWLSACGRGEMASQWTPEELRQIQSFSIANLGTPLPDASNPVADDPRAADFGRKLFFDRGMSANGKLACASCHRPELQFSDGKPVAEGAGKLDRNAPSLVGAAWSPWLMWDGRADSLWSQAMVPLENPKEMGFARSRLVGFLADHHRADYEALFGALPQPYSTAASPAGTKEERAAWSKLPAADQHRVNQVLVNVGRALEAYERTLRPQPAPFDRYADALQQNDRKADELLSPEARAGLKLFLTKGQCTRCHTGPLLSNHGFHNTGLMPLEHQTPDKGRASGALDVLASPFNCRSEFSAAKDKTCPHLEFIRTSGAEIIGAFKTPSLRNLAATAPYMHDGRFATLKETLDHYNRAPVTYRLFGHTEIIPLGMSERELADLEAFLRTLSTDSIK